MDLLQFLNHRDTNLDAVVLAVKQHMGLLNDDILLAVGSLVEGLGNLKSDVDLFLITDRVRSELPEKEEFALFVGRCVIDLHILLYPEVKSLVDRLHAWSDQPWDVSHSVNFSLAERTLLHRFLHGFHLVDPSPSRLAEITPNRSVLCRLKLQTARQMARTIQVDLVGYHESGDYRTAAFSAQDLLGQAVDALTAGHGLTHPVPKWRHRLLDRLPGNWSDELPITNLPMSTASDFIWSLHRLPEHPQYFDCTNHTARIVGFARAAFIWSEIRLVNSHFSQVLIGQNDAVDKGSLLPPLDFDVDYHLADGKAYLARLNEFDPPVILTPEELTTALLFDGSTSASKVVRLMEASQSINCVDDVLALHQRLSDASLVKRRAKNFGGDGY
jgi:hypothetical protein